MPRPARTSRASTAAGRPGALPGGFPGEARRRVRPRHGQQLGRQETSVQRFLELSGDDFRRRGNRLAAIPLGVPLAFRRGRRRGELGLADKLLGPLGRTKVLIVVGFLVFVFLGISALLARCCRRPGPSRGARAGGRRGAGARRRGRPRADARLRPSARLRGDDARGFVAKLRRPGPSRSSSTARRCRGHAHAHDSQAGASRGARDTGLPVVQCVRVRREGPLTGNGVELLSISAPIPEVEVVREHPCRRRLC